MLDLIEAGGSAMNGAAADAWLGYAEMICSVTAIDQIPVHMPSSKEEIKELARRLGHDGVDALLAAFEETATPRLELLDVSKN
ncbi:hypothetical protein [Ameyamaea chiangmaiensis]|nr:hypothetical protein [Ameyamaea chiangmaiensis]